MTLKQHLDLVRAETDQHVCRIWRIARFKNGDYRDLQHKAIQLMTQHDLSKRSTMDLVATELARDEHIVHIEIVERTTGRGVGILK